MNVKKQYPSLHFISLQNFTKSMDQEDDTDDDEGTVLKEETAITGTSTASNTRILELEEEVKRLKEMLAQTAGINATLSV